jgi:hypothetical protein
MAIAQALPPRLELHRARAAHSPHIDGLLGLALLGMFCALQAAWLATGSPADTRIIAAAEYVALPE